MDIERLLKGSYFERDEATVGRNLAKVGRLILTNPFSQRMVHLLENQKLATTKVRNTRGELSAPNCIGTAFYIAGVGTLSYPYHGYDFELNPHMRSDKDAPMNDCLRFHP